MNERGGLAVGMVADATPAVRKESFFGGGGPRLAMDEAEWRGWRGGFKRERCEQKGYVTSVLGQKEGLKLGFPRQSM